MDHRRFGDRIHHSALFPPHRCAGISLCNEFFLAWMYYRSCIVGNLLYIKSSWGVLKIGFTQEGVPHFVGYVKKEATFSVASNRSVEIIFIYSVLFPNHILPKRLSLSMNW